MADPTPSPLGKQDIDRLVQEAVAAMRKGDVAGAHAIAERGIAAGAEHPFLLKVKALWLQNAGQYREALRSYHHARTLTPDDPSILIGIAGCLSAMGEHESARQMADAAVEMSPEAAAAHYLRGWVLENARDFPAAGAAYARTVALSPTHVQALAGQASVATQANDFATARKQALQALRHDPQQPTATIALAMAEAEEGDAAAAEARLRRLLEAADRLPPRARALAHGVLGDALDAQDRTDEAFAAYRHKAEEFQRQYDAAMTGRQSATEALQRLTAQIEAMPAEAWQTPTPAAAEDAPRSHVFLLGFLRSGTTLLEQTLAGHDDVVTLEERDILGPLAREYLDTPDGLERLAGLAAPARESARAAYWQRVREHGVEPAGKVFIDKEPLNTFNLPLIAKLFPEAKVIFAMRDPRDVTFSCFRRHFEINPTIFELLTLDGAAQLYAQTMALAEVCRSQLPLTVHAHRYEDMIADFEASTRAACEAIGLDWRDSLRDFAEQARARAIRSPSAGQVRRGLYGEGIGQWRRYAKQLDAVQPILAPWVQAFGYTQN